MRRNGESFIFVVFVLSDGFSFLFLDEKKRNKEKSRKFYPSAHMAIAGPGQIFMPALLSLLQRDCRLVLNMIIIHCRDKQKRFFNALCIHSVSYTHLRAHETKANL